MVRAAAWAALAACIAAARALPSVPLLTQTATGEDADTTCTDGHYEGDEITAVAMSSTSLFVTASDATNINRRTTAAIVWSLSSDGKTATRLASLPVCTGDGTKDDPECIGIVGNVVDIALSKDSSVVVVAESGQEYASVFSLGRGGAPAAGLVLLPECQTNAAGNKVDSNCNGHFNHRGIESVAISTDNSLVVTAGGDGIAVVWSLDVATKPQNGLVTITNPSCSGMCTFNDVAISKNKKFIVIASDDHTAIVSKLTIGNPTTVTTIATLQGHTSEVTSVALSADNTRIVTGSHDGTAIVWKFDPQLETTEKLATLQQCRVSQAEGCTGTSSDDDIHDLALSDDGQMLVTVSTVGLAVWSLGLDGDTALLAVKTRFCVRSGPTTCIVFSSLKSVALSSDKRTLITGDGNGIVFVWSLAQFVDPPPTPKPTPAPTTPPPPPPTPGPWMSSAAQTVTGVALGTVMAVVPIAAATREP